jgi:hypothetical protein
MLRGESDSRSNAACGSTRSTGRDSATPVDAWKPVDTLRAAVEGAEEWDELLQVAEDARLEKEGAACAWR